MKHDRAPKEPVQREQPAARSKKPAEHQPAEGWSNPMLRMQRAAGNRSVTAMIETARRAPSQPLDPGTRSYMEPLFRTDLSGVRLYTGDAAAKSARGLGANAYTVGQDIVFGAGSYSPGTVEGRRLLAHELAHTVQQCQPGSGGGLSSAGPGIGIQPKSSLLESEAVCAAGYTGGPVSAGPMALSRAAGLTIARDTPTGAAAPAAQPPAAQPADAGAPPAAAVAAAAPAPRPTAVPAPPLGGAWPEDPEGVYATLEQMVKDRGLEDTKQYVKDYEENAKSATYDVEDTSGASDERNKAKADAARRTTTAGVLNEQLAKIKQRIDEIRPKFKPDVERIAFRRLFENEQYIRKEMEAFGFSLVGLPGADPVKMAGKNQGPKLQETQRLAKQLFQLDRTRTEMRNAIVDMDFGKFDPQVPPPRNKVIQIGDASTWEYLKENWDAASELMGRILNSNPAIFAAWSRGTAADLSAADPTKNPEQMLRTVFDLLDNLHKNIQKAKSNLESEVCDYRDLKPIHQQMAAGLAVASGTKWNEPLAMWVMQDEIGSHAASEAWIKLGLQAAAMIVAITATLATGGAAAFLIGAAASVGAAGGTLIMAENKYASLKIAAASQVKSNEQLVDRAQVREAEAEVEAQRINFAVTAVLALGSHYAGTAVSGAIAQGLFKAAPSALGVGQTLALTVISGTVIGATSSALTTAATEFQRMSRGEITSGEYLSRIGVSSIQGAILGVVSSSIVVGVKAATAPKPGAPAVPEKPSTALTVPEPNTPIVVEPPARPLGPKGLPGGSSAWETKAVTVDEAGVLRFWARHKVTGDVISVEYNSLTGNGWINVIGKGVILIEGGYPIAPPRPLLPQNAGPSGPVPEVPSQAGGGSLPSGGSPSGMPQGQVPAGQLPGSPAPKALPPGPTQPPALPGGPPRVLITPPPLATTPFLSIKQILSPKGGAFTDPEVEAAYNQYCKDKLKAKETPASRDDWLRLTRGGNRALLEKLLGPDFLDTVGEDRRVKVTDHGRPPGYTDDRINADVAAVSSDPKLWSELTRLQAEGVVGGEIGQRDWNKLRGNIAEILAEGIKSRDLSAIRAADAAAGRKGPPARFVRAVRARIPGMKESVQFSDDLIVSERGGNLTIRVLYEVKAGPHGGQEATGQIHKWIEGHLADGFELVVEIDGVQKTFVYAPESAAKGRAISLARAPRVMITAAGAENLGAGGAKQVAAPTTREALTQTPDEINWLARIFLNTLAWSPAPPATPPAAAP